jgi:hypothetical protein
LLIWLKVPLALVCSTDVDHGAVVFCSLLITFAFLGAFILIRDLGFLLAPRIDKLAGVASTIGQKALAVNVAAGEKAAPVLFQSWQKVQAGIIWLGRQLFAVSSCSGTVCDECIALTGSAAGYLLPFCEVLGTD